MQIKYINCEYCGSPFDGKETSCPKCGAENKLSSLFVAEDEADKKFSPFSQNSNTNRTSVKKEPVRETRRKKGIMKEIFLYIGVLFLLAAIFEIIILFI